MLIFLNIGDGDNRFSFGKIPRPLQHRRYDLEGPQTKH